MAYNYNQYRRGLSDDTVQLSLRIPKSLSEKILEAIKAEGDDHRINNSAFVRRLLEQGLFLRTKLKVG